MSTVSLTDSTEKLPNLDFAQLKFVLSFPEKRKNMVLLSKLLDDAITNTKAPWYERVCADLNLPVDAEMLATMREKNTSDLEGFQDAIKEAEKQSLNDVEIRDAYVKKAEYLSRIGDQKNALVALEEVLEKTVPITHKIDILFHCIRIGFFFMNHQVIASNLERVEKLVEDGGSWDLRNRLKVYKGLYLMAIRKFKEACDLFLDSINTFTCTELLNYDIFTKYAILIAVVVLPRKELTEKVIRAPEIQTVLFDKKTLKQFVYSLYNCQYSEFFRHLARVEQSLKLDMFLNPHYRYYVREMKIKAYAQLLDSYRSLSLEFMANAFGVTPEYIDQDLAKFIAAGRLACKIDKVGGIVFTNRPDCKAGQFLEVVKHGDLLLNRVQKLSRVINI